MPSKKPDWIQLRELAAEWGVNRVWLSGLVEGMELPTGRGRFNATLIRSQDRDRLSKRVEQLTTVDGG